jgi:hypothetical protein
MIETTNVEILSTDNHIVSIESGAIIDYTLLFPPNAGSNGQVLTTDGTGVLTWTNGLTGGTVTSVGLTATSTIFSVSGSPVTSSGSLALAYNGVALPAANGGTGLTSVGSNGNVLTVVSGAPAWTAPATSGTVTSVSASTPSVFSVSVSNPTTTPSITMSYSGTALPVVNGGTGVTTSSGASSVVLRDTNQNIFINNTVRGTQTIVSAGASTSLTVATPYNILVTGSSTQTLVLPDATLLSNSFNYLINNNSSGGGVVIKNNGGTTLTSIPVGGMVYIILLDNSTSNGAWDYHFQAPSNVSWGTSSFSTSSNLQTSAQLVSTVSTGTAPLSVTSTTNVANLNASSLNGATFATPGTIGGGTAGAATFTTLAGTTSVDTPLVHVNGTHTVTLNPASATTNYNFTYPVDAGTTGQFLTSASGSTLTWTTPSTNASTLLGNTWAAPGTIGGTTPGIVNATTVNSSSLTVSVPVFTDGSKNLISGSQTGTGTKVVVDTSPTLVTPNIGVATGTSLQAIIGNVTPAAGTFTTITSTAQAGVKTNFSGVSSYDVSIDLTTYQMVEIVIIQSQTNGSAVNCLIQYNSSVDWNEYYAVFQKYNVATPVTDNTHYLFENSGVGVEESYAIIRVTKQSISSGRYILDVRGSYVWSGVGQTRIDATGYTVTTPTAIHISTTAGTMVGSYTVRNLV